MLEVEVGVLSPPVAIDTRQACRVGEHGIILSKNGRRAIYLPEVAPRKGRDCAETLKQLSLKAGLEGDAWLNGARLEVFTAQKYAPPR